MSDFRFLPLIKEDLPALLQEVSPSRRSSEELSALLSHPRYHGIRFLCGNQTAGLLFYWRLRGFLLIEEILPSPDSADRAEDFLFSFRDAVSSDRDGLPDGDGSEKDLLLCELPQRAFPRFPDHDTANMLPCLFPPRGKEKEFYPASVLSPEKALTAADADLFIQELIRVGKVLPAPDSVPSADLLRRGFPVRAVIFDVDGTMFDTEHVQLRAWKVLGKRMGMPDLPDFAHRCIGRQQEDCKRLFRETYGEDAPLEYVWSESHRICQEMLAEHLPVKEGLFELLTYLEKKNIRTAVATSTKRDYTEWKFRTAGLTHQFDVITTGDTVTRGKPDPEIFLKTADALGVSPMECLILEDSRNGIKAGAASGIRTVMIPDVFPSDDELAALYYCRADTLHEIIPLIESLER